MPSPTLTQTPSPTLMSTPSRTPAATSSSSAAATPGSTPIPAQTQSPAPPSDPHLEAALHLQTNGDYAEAIAAYLAFLADEPAPDWAREARYHLAETYVLNREHLAAAAILEAFIADYPGDGLLPAAMLMAARAYHAANDCTNAVAHYVACLDQENILADSVYEWIGDCHAAGGDLNEALDAYRQALSATGDRGTRADLRETISGILLALGDYEAAVTEYDAILDIARIDDYRARMEYQAGQALYALGQTEAAFERFHRVVNDYPETAHAYLSLIELVDAGVEADEFQRGLVDYYAGDAYPDAYGAAVRAFDRYLVSGVTDRVDEALYRKALALRGMGMYGDALDALDSVAQEFPRSPWLARAWMEKAVTLAEMGEILPAVKAFQDVAAFFPGEPQAPKALWRAAKLHESVGAYVDAARLYEDLQARFPAFEDADQALWRAGPLQYRSGEPDGAARNWQALADKYPKSVYRPKSLYWLGKLETASGKDFDSEHWDLLVKEDPNSYYALRVQQLRSGDSLTSSRFNTAALEPPAWDAAKDEAETLAWLGEWTQVPAGSSLMELPNSLTRRRAFRRGEAFLAAGLRREALDAFDSVRAAVTNDPLALAQLADYFHEAGLPSLAARSALRLVGLWPDGVMADAPEAVQRLAYPLLYADLLSAEAQARDLDPLLLAALVRQESLFEPSAESYAGARGLGQVMPATGQGIANTLGMDEFVLDDLYRPMVSVEFGAFYLAVQLDRFDDHILVALAAYNGGPGNTLYWLESAGDLDFDFFVEVITATQSRVYLQHVYEHYLRYEDLYRPHGDG